VINDEICLHKEAVFMIARPFYVNARLSDEEHREIERQAEASRLTVSEYIRRRVLGKRVTSQADLAVLTELRRLGGLLKHAHLETKGTYSELTANAIQTLEAYARTLELIHKEKGGATLA
jgi:hypothetical protein